MKILINQSVGYLFADIANTLSTKDYVVMICSQRKKSGNVTLISDKVKCDFIIEYDKSSTLKRLWTWVIATLQIWWKVISKYRKDELLIVSNPPFANLLALVLPNKQISHLVYDIYPEVLISSHILSERNIITRLWRKANRKIYNRAKCIYTIGEGMADSLSQYLPKEKIEIVNCWPDGTNIQHIDKNENCFIKEQGFEGKFVILYSGNMGNTHRVEVLVDVAEKLKEYKDIMFVLVGEGGKKKIIERKIKDIGLKNVRLLSYQPVNKLSHSLSSADLGVVTLDVTASNLSVPSKIFNLMQVGAALIVLGSANSELGYMLNKYNMGRVFNPDNVDDIAAFVLDMKDHPEHLAKYKKNVQEGLKNYSVKNAGLFYRP